MHKIGKKDKGKITRRNEKKEQEEHTENKVKKWNKKKEDKNKNEVKNKKEENQRRYTARQKEVLKMEAKNLLLNLKMCGNKEFKQTSTREETFFVRNRA